MLQPEVLQVVEELEVVQLQEELEAVQLQEELEVVQLQEVLEVVQLQEGLEVVQQEGVPFEAQQLQAFLPFQPIRQCNLQYFLLIHRMHLLIFD